MTSTEHFLRENAETLMYVGFFGLLILLALIELVAQLAERPPERRKRWPANFALTTLNIVLLGAVPVSAVVFADTVSDQGIGLIPALGLPLWAAVLGGILVRSLSSWWVHMTMHKTPLLWRIHKVHHTDPSVDVSTTVRFHPLEFAVHIPVNFGLIYVFGIPAVAILIYELLDAVLNVFSHANIRIPRWLSRTMGLVFVTPDIHHVHHSAWHRETDSNYGATLVIWDRAFGTFRQKPRDDLRTMRRGLGAQEDATAHSLGAQLLLPFWSREPVNARPQAGTTHDRPEGSRA